ncbi:MAG: hypothetical protein JWN12_702 [Candidatus Saccharibacteria bacterium]|nr:hypothetical protein [Candidatus Saccharibacteria bacterium]
MPELSERIVSRVEQKFDRGENHFTARGILATIAIGLMDPQPRQDILLDSNERIVRLLQERDAEGEVYALREDLGNGEQDTTDYVLVTNRNGIETGAERARMTGRVILRATTAEIDY